MWLVTQAAAAAALMLALHLRQSLRMPGQDDISRLEEFDGPVGRCCSTVLHARLNLSSIMAASLHQNLQA